MSVEHGEIGVLLDGIAITQGFGPTPIENIKTWSGLEFLTRILNDQVPQPSIHRALNFRLVESAKALPPSSECPPATI